MINFALCQLYELNLHGSCNFCLITFREIKAHGPTFVHIIQCSLFFMIKHTLQMFRFLPGYFQMFVKKNWTSGFCYLGHYSPPLLSSWISQEMFRLCGPISYSLSIPSLHARPRSHVFCFQFTKIFFFWLFTGMFSFYLVSPHWPIFFHYFWSLKYLQTEISLAFNEGVCRLTH